MFTAICFFNVPRLIYYPCTVVLHGILLHAVNKIEVTSPLAVAWSDEVIKCRLAAKISTFGAYGHVHVCSNLTNISLHFINNISLFN